MTRTCKHGDPGVSRLRALRLAVLDIGCHLHEAGMDSGLQKTSLVFRGRVITGVNSHDLPSTKTHINAHEVR